MPFSRRHVLGLAAGAATGAAMPAGAVAEAGFVTIGPYEIVKETWETEGLVPRPHPGPLYWPRPPVFNDDGTLAEPYGEKVPWIEVDGRMVEADPVRHPEGREDPQEYA